MLTIGTDEVETARVTPDHNDRPASNARETTKSHHEISLSDRKQLGIGHFAPSPGCRSATSPGITEPRQPAATLRIFQIGIGLLTAAGAARRVPALRVNATETETYCIS